MIRASLDPELDQSPGCVQTAGGGFKLHVHCKMEWQSILHPWIS